MYAYDVRNALLLHTGIIMRTIQTTGGPAVMVWGWVVVSVFTLIIGAAMGGAFLSFSYHILRTIGDSKPADFRSVIPAQRCAAPIPRAVGPISGRQCFRIPDMPPSRAGSQAGSTSLAKLQ